MSRCVGWSAPGWREDYVAQSAAFESEMLELLAERVFQEFFPELGWCDRIGLRLDAQPACGHEQKKSWRGMRAKYPWISTVCPRKSSAACSQ